MEETSERNSPETLSRSLNNSFYRDFNDAGKRWTRPLCEMDSDGDGVSNGAELGDPECKVGSPPPRSFYLRNNPSDVALHHLPQKWSRERRNALDRTANITHPGFNEFDYGCAPFGLDSRAKSSLGDGGGSSSNSSADDGDDNGIATTIVTNETSSISSNSSSTSSSSSSSSTNSSSTNSSSAAIVTSGRRIRGCIGCSWNSWDWFPKAGVPSFWGL